MGLAILVIKVWNRSSDVREKSSRITTVPFYVEINQRVLHYSRRNLNVVSLKYMFCSLQQFLSKGVKHLALENEILFFFYLLQSNDNNINVYFIGKNITKTSKQLFSL